MKFPHHKLLPITLLLASFLVIGLIVWNAVDGIVEQKESASHLSNTNKDVSSIPKISIAEICDCYIVAGTLNPYLVVDAVSNQAVDFLPITNRQDENQSQSMYISPSGTHYAAITEFRKSIEYRSGAAGTVRAIYRAPSGKIINWLIWAGDDETLLIGLGNEKDLQPAEGSHPTEVVAYEINGGAVSTIVHQTDVQQKGIQEIFPLAATKGAKKILFSSGGVTEQNFWMWTPSNGLRLLTNSFIGSIYFASVQAEERTKFLTYYKGLHAFDVEAETEMVYPMNGWSDSPVSQPSPDGKYIVFLKRDETASQGFPTLLSLADGKEYRLTNHAVGDTGSMAGSFWAPDSTYFIFNPDYQKPAEYFVLDRQRVNQTPQFLELPSVLRDNTIYRLIEKS